MTKRRIVVAITGGIAAYKAVNVVRELVLDGHDVHVIATDSGLRFVGVPTLEAISRNPVHTDLYEGVAEVRHVALGQSADLVVIAPATANTMAKVAVGIADDLLGNTLLATKAPVLIAPAMHTEMWHHPATQANVRVLLERGVHIVGPEVGRLTGSDTGVGRMAEPEAIVRSARSLLSMMDRSRDLDGRRVVVSAGGTREPLDPVRFLGNRSSGRQGIAIADAAVARGADVLLVAANLEVEPSLAYPVRRVGTALELRDAMEEAAADADIVVMAAAVADYRPAESHDDKIKKDEHKDEATLRLIKNPDILAGLTSRSRPGRIVVGFAAETETDDDRLLELGRGKLERKDADYLVVNRVGWELGFSSEDNSVIVLGRGGDVLDEASGDKVSVAHRILDVLVEHGDNPSREKRST